MVRYVGSNVFRNGDDRFSNHEVMDRDVLKEGGSPVED